jgi:hypothetical protein
MTMRKFTMRDDGMAKHKMWKSMGTMWKLMNPIVDSAMRPLGRLWRRRRPEIYITAVGTIAVSFTMIALSIKPEGHGLGDRIPAAHSDFIHEKKLPILKPHGQGLDQGSAGEGREANKGGGNLQVTIISTQNEKTEAGQVLHLVASIQSLAEINGLEYAWLLPADVSVVSGARDGTIGHLAQGAETKLELTIKSPSSVPRQLDLHVYRMVGGEAHGQITQFKTTKESKFEDENAKKKFSLIDDNGKWRGSQQSERPMRIQQ